MPNDLNEANEFAGSERPHIADTDLVRAARALTKAWGWDNPSAEVLRLAETALMVKNMPVGEIIVEWGILPKSRVAELLRSKPAEVLTLKYIKDAVGSSVDGQADKILALKEQIPYYANLSELQVSAQMKSDPAVHRKCEQLDAVLMTTDNRTRVLVFARHEKLKVYTRLGRGDLATDPIWSEDLLFAAGSRDDISTILKGSAQNGAAELKAQGGTLLASEGADTDEMRELTRVIDHALSIGATDISVKPHGNNGSYKVRLRRWGRLIHPFKQQLIWNPELGPKILQLLGVTSEANPRIETQRLPSDGNLKYRSAAGGSDFRLNFIPLNKRGDLKNLRSLAMRIFRDSEKRSVTFDELGVPETIRRHIRDALRSSSGMIVVMGPVGHGKSSLFASIISEHVAMYGDSQERLSLEHPVERELEGITQFEVPIEFVDDEAEAWRLSLRAFKRHDLDFAYVGEMRDRHSGEFCVSVGAMGQMAVSTMHAKDTIVGFDIIRQMLPVDLRFQGVEAFKLAIGVRLINCVCNECCEKNALPNEEEKHLFTLALENTGEELALPETVYRANPAGCDLCDNGYGDYVQIYEVLPFTRVVKDAAISMLSASDLRADRREMAAARKTTLLASGLDLLRQNKVDIQSLLSIM
jgi:type II secretory ATPase GspE/PulE/Tfp pilus assembly ATPase PilB-like protein